MSKDPFTDVFGRDRYEQAWERHVRSSSQTPSQTSFTTRARSNTNSYSPTDSATGSSEAGAAGLGMLLVGAALAAGAVVAGIYGLSKFVLDKARGEKPENKIYAGVITAGLLGSSYLVYNAYQDHQKNMLQKYPHLSISVDSAGNIYGSTPTKSATAQGSALRACSPKIFNDCRALLTTDARNLICVAVSKNNLEPGKYFYDFFGKGRSDDLTDQKLLFASALMFQSESSKKKATSIYGPISYFCNNDEMADTLDKLKKQDQELEAVIQDLLHPQSKTDPKLAPAQLKPTYDFFAVTATSLNVRTGPSVSARKNYSFLDGSCLVAEHGKAADNGFLKIMGLTRESKRIDGYVSERYLSPIGHTPSTCFAVLKQ